MLMLVTKTHKISSIEITYISYSFNTAKPSPINGCIRISHLTFIFNFDSSLTLKKSYNFPRHIPLKCLNNALCFCLAKMPGKKILA